MCREHFPNVCDNFAIAYGGAEVVTSVSAILTPGISLADTRPCKTASESFPRDLCWLPSASISSSCPPIVVMKSVEDWEGDNLGGWSQDFF